MKKSRLIILLCVILELGCILHFRNVTIAETQSGDVNSDTKEYIKWVDFDVTCEAMGKAYQYDLDTYGKEVHLDWVSLLAYLGAKYGGDFSRYEDRDMEEAAAILLSGEKTVEDFAKEMQYYAYYREAYGAVLDGMVGEYEVEYAVDAEFSEEMDELKKEDKAGIAGESKKIDESEVADESKKVDESGVANESKQADKSETTNKSELAGEPDTLEKTDTEEKASMEWKKVYGLKSFHPIAKGFPYSHYDDFGVSRSYGYRRNHLGHDMMGQVGTPVIAVESGYVTELGWNQYGGWRIGISSVDDKRYYYYAHLRQNRPYAEGLKKGDTVQAGDVIGYMGRTGYSSEENVNNIDVHHLHFGLQLIFDESQREGNNEIWVNGYELVKFLYRHQSETQRNDETKEWTRIYQIKDPVVEAKI